MTRFTTGTLFLATLFIAGSSNLALAQATTTVTRTTDPTTHTVSTTATETGPNGKTRSDTVSYTNNHDGTVTRTASQTGVNGRTRTSTATAGNGSASSSVTRRNGTVINRSRTRVR